MKGGTTFYFVTDGIESALEQARAAAGDKDVSLGGGARVAQQYLAAGLLDEILVSIAPVMLGSGARLFDNLGGRSPRSSRSRQSRHPESRTSDTRACRRSGASEGVTWNRRRWSPSRIWRGSP